VVISQVLPEVVQAEMRFVGRGAAKEFEPVALGFVQEPSVGTLKYISLEVAIWVCADERLQVVKDMIPVKSTEVSSCSIKQALYWGRVTSKPS
jgi:hypothetical protein